MEPENTRYKALISYRHVDSDRKWAKWPIEKLETYRHSPTPAPSQQIV